MIDKIKTQNSKYYKTDNIETIDEKTNATADDFIDEYCPVLWVKSYAFAIQFHEYGISFHTKNGNIFDASLIGKIIKVKYRNTIGKPDFEIHPVYE